MGRTYLVGFMGTGKSTVGAELSKFWGIPVFDTDVEIVHKEKKTINEIFQSQGEAYFRKLESDVLKEIGNDDCIITTGGGIILKEENRNFLKEKGRVVLLKASIDEIIKRLETDESRPLLQKDKKQSVITLYNDRLNYYEEVADIIINTTGKTIEQVVTEITGCLTN